jgi:hypothetical protein
MNYYREHDQLDGRGFQLRAVARVSLADGKMPVFLAVSEPIRVHAMSARTISGRAGNPL